MYDGTMKNVRQQDTATEIQITSAQSEDILSARINQKTDFVYNAKTGELKIGEETFVTDAVILDFSLLFDDVILEITQIGKECHQGCEIMKQVGSCIMPTQGIFGKVLKTGMIHVGDEVSIIK